MDGLKRSLEEAIKEMQHSPAASQPSARHDPDLRLARAADTLQTMHPAPNPAPTQNSAPAPESASGHIAQAAPELTASDNSIEAALSSAPAVSPHYVPPEPAAIPAMEPAALVAPTLAAPPLKPAHENRAPKRAALRLETPKVSIPRRATAVMKDTTVFSGRQSTGPNGAPPIQKASDGSLDLGKKDDVSAGLAENAKTPHVNLWRWATIGISCAGGLASGWLGSNISDQPNGIFQASVQTIVGKATDSASAAKPGNVKIVPQGAAKFMSGTTIGDLPANLTGKTDRAIPLDDDLCTVLELDRGTGLTLARPCKMIETAEFNTTLGKSDLLARPE